MARRNRYRILCLAAVCIAVIPAPLPSMAGADSPGMGISALTEHLNIPLVCTRTLEEISLGRMDGPRASVLLFSRGVQAAESFALPMKVIAPLVMRYGEYIDWYRIMVREDRGVGSPLPSSCPVLFRNSLYDSDGRLAAALGISSYPAAVIIEEDGRVVRSMEGDNLKDIAGAERVLQGILVAHALRGKPAHDFLLPAAGTGWPLCLLDTVTREYTMFLFLTAGTESEMAAIKVLEMVRNRNRSAAGLVAVFRDGSFEPRAADVLRERGIFPDYALFDSDMRLSDTYGFAEMPLALIVVGPGGKIVFSMMGFEPSDILPVAQLLEGIFSRTATGTTSFRDARQIHTAAMDWLREGRKDMALLYFQRVLELYPEFNSVNYVMAEIYTQMGMRREAARCYSRSLAAGVCDVSDVRQRLKYLLESAP